MKTEALATDVLVMFRRLNVDLSDGRTISVPLDWYPKLESATPSQRKNWRLIGKGEGIHWPEVDEDISVKNLLNGESGKP